MHSIGYGVQLEMCVSLHVVSDAISNIGWEWIEGDKGKTQLHLTWTPPDGGGGIYFISLLDPDLSTEPPDCRSQGNSLRCFVTNTTVKPCDTSLFHCLHI